MTSGGNSFNDFPEIVPTVEITTKTENTSFSRPWPWAYFLNGPNTEASIASTLIRHCSNVFVHSSPTEPLIENSWPTVLKFVKINLCASLLNATQHFSGFIVTAFVIL